MDADPCAGNTPGTCPSIAGFHPLPPGRLALATTGVMLAMFLAAFSQTIVATAMPGIIADLGGFDRYTWPATAYLAATAVAIPIVGGLSDRYGRRVFLICGLVVFTLSSVPAGLSQSMNQLVACRALQGIGGGIIMASSFAAGADLYPPRHRGRFQAYAGLASGMAAILGALLGGFITDRFAWNWIFLLNVPVGAGVLMTALAFPKIRPEVEDRRLDYPGMATLALAVVPVMIGLSRLHDASATATGLLAFGVAMATAFVIIESKSDHPVMPLQTYRDRTVAVSLIVVFLNGFGLFGSLLFVPLFFQGTQGVSAAHSGGLLAPMVFGLVIGAVVSGQLMARSGGPRRAHAVASTGLLALAMVLLSTMDAATGLPRGMAYLLLAGIGVGAMLATFRLIVQNSVTFGLVGAATSALQFSRLLSGTLGLAVLGAVMARSFAARLDDSLSESVRAALTPGRLDAIKADPRALVDPAAAAALTAALEPHGAGMADMVLGSLQAALSAAIGDVFAVSAAAAVLSFVAAMFLGTPPDGAAAGHASEGNGRRTA